MRAVRLIAHGRPGQFEICDVPDPVPGPDEVIVEVTACGLNHLDLWLEEAGLPIPLKLPRIPGCEIAGRVLAWGPEAGTWQVGEAVAAPSSLFCGKCESCLRAQESMCLNSVMLGVDRDGGLAQKVAVPGRALARLPDTVSCETAAALALAGSTAMHMLTRRVQVHVDDWVLVMAGASGVGSAAIQIAHRLGARVISTGSTPAKRALAAQLGAEFVVDAGQPGWTGEIRRITGRQGVDVVVEHVGGAVLEQLFGCLARGGTIVTCGATAGRNISLNLWPFFVKQHRLIGSYSRDHADLQATLQWAAEGKLKPVIDRVFPLERTPAAFAALRARSVLGKLLVKP